MRLPDTAHTSRPWRIHEVTQDFRLEDVWELPTPGGREDFPRLVRLIASFEPSQSSSAAVRTLFAIRSKLGELLGLDRPQADLGARAPRLRDRLPVDLRDTAPGSDSHVLPFTPLYFLADEWAAELANRTVHGVIHLGWVPDGTGAYRGQMAILVKPHGRRGTAYMAAIAPFRHLIVYPAIIRQIERGWRARPHERTPAGGVPTPVDPCPATQVPPLSPPPRRRRGGELSEEDAVAGTAHDLLRHARGNETKGDRSDELP